MRVLRLPGSFLGEGLSASDATGLSTIGASSGDWTGALIDAGLIGYMFELKSFWKMIQQLEDPQDFYDNSNGRRL